MATSTIAVYDFLTVKDCIFRAFLLYKLVVTSTYRPLALLHLPLFKTAHANVLTKKHVESGIDVLKHTVANEDDSVEPVKNHANLSSRVPTIMTVSWKERGIKAMASATAHCLEEGSPVRAVRETFTIVLMSSWRDVQVCG